MTEQNSEIKTKIWAKEVSLEVLTRCAEGVRFTDRLNMKSYYLSEVQRCKAEIKSLHLKLNPPQQVNGQMLFQTEGKPW